MESSAKRQATNGGGNPAKKKKENGAGSSSLLDDIMQDMENTYVNAIIPELTDFITTEVAKIIDKHPM